MPFHVKHLLVRASLQVWLPLVVLMTFLAILFSTSHPQYGLPSSGTAGQVPHFVCTVDGDGTLLRCHFSAIGMRQL